MVVKPPSSNTPQISSTGLFLPYTLKKKPTKTNASSEQQQVESDEDDDDDDDQTDFLGLTKSNQVQVTNTDVESVLRETYPKARPIVIEAPPMPMPEEEFEDLDQEEPTGHQMTTSIDDDDEVTPVYFEMLIFVVVFVCVLALTLSPQERTLQGDQACAH